jgi:hypothetical protein
MPQRLPLPHGAVTVSFQRELYETYTDFDSIRITFTLCDTGTRLLRVTDNETHSVHGKQRRDLRASGWQYLAGEIRV